MFSRNDKMAGKSKLLSQYKLTTMYSGKIFILDKSNKFFQS